MLKPAKLVRQKLSLRSDELQHYASADARKQKLSSHTWKRVQVAGSRGACDFCSLLRDSSDSYRCTVCGMIIHPKCQRLVRDTCSALLRSETLDLEVEYAQQGLWGRSLEVPLVSEITTEGYLKHRVKKGWKKHFFVLGRGDALMWWKTPPSDGLVSAVPDGSCLLQDATIQISPDAPHAFAISGHGVMLVLAAANDEERDGWISSIERARHRFRTQVQELLENKWWTTVPMVRATVLRKRGVGEEPLLVDLLDDNRRLQAFERDVECYNADAAARAPYMMKLVRVEGVASGEGQRIEEALGRLFVVVRALYAGEHLDEPVFSSLSRADGAFSHGHLMVSRSLASLHPAAHLLVSLYRLEHGGKDGGRRSIAIGYTCLALCDEWGRLATGPRVCSLWPGEGSLIHSATGQASAEHSVGTLYLELPAEAPLPCVYPSMYPSEYVEKCPLPDRRGLFKREGVQPLAEDAHKGVRSTEGGGRRAVLHFERFRTALDVISPEDRVLFWTERDVSDPRKLYNALIAQDPSDPEQRAEVRSMLSDPTKVVFSPLTGFLMMCYDCPDPTARALAIGYLLSAPEEEFLWIAYALLSSLISFEPHTSTLASEMLLRSVYRSNYRMAHAYFWSLHALSKRPKPFAEPAGVLARLISDRFPQLLTSISWVTKLLGVCNHPSRKEVPIRQLLEEMGDPPEPIELPTDIAHVTIGVIADKCKVMSSKAAPVMMRFRPAEPEKPLPVMIFKAGDELGQDHMVMMMATFFNRVWKAEEIDAHIIVYNCLPLANRLGVIEVVPDCVSLGSVQGYKMHGSLSDETLVTWIKSLPGDASSILAQYQRTLVGTVLLEHILGIGDRHSDNILLKEDGSIFHIDFGMPFHHDWGITKNVPFNLTSQMASVIGPLDSLAWKSFVDRLVHAYMVIRRLHVIIVAGLTLALGAEMRELSRVENIKAVHDALAVDVLDQEAEARFRQTIEKALDTKRPQFNDWMHGFYIRNFYKAAK